VAAQRAGDIFRDIQHARGQADSSLEIGVISQLGGDLDATEKHLRRALNLFREARARRDEALTLAALANAPSRPAVPPTGPHLRGGRMSARGRGHLPVHRRGRERRVTSTVV
jgi:hypothetical protein